MPNRCKCATRHKLIRHLKVRQGIKLFEHCKNQLFATPEARTLLDATEREYRGVVLSQRLGDPTGA